MTISGEQYIEKLVEGILRSSLSDEKKDQLLQKIDDGTFDQADVTVVTGVLDKDVASLDYMSKILGQDIDRMNKK